MASGDRIAPAAAAIPGPVTGRVSDAVADRYRIERHLGAGGMATVYLAQDLRHERKVAIKVLKPELAAVLGAERFVVEIKTTASLQHPHILPLFDSGTADGFLYYVMPYIQGETIREKLNRETQFGVDEAIRITREVADALDYAHRHGVIHRDIKPENILLHDGRAMVMDFGIALAVSAAAGGRMTETGLSLGTPHYMSPEQATADKDVTGRSDIYSLGTVLYEMLAGQPPHLGGSAQQIIMKIITETPQPVMALRRSVPPNVAAAVAKALEKLPADRFESVRAFSDALGTPAFSYGAVGTAAIGQSPSHAAPATRVAPAARRGLIGASAVAVLATAAAAWAWLRPVPPPPTMRFDLTVGPAPLAQNDVSISPDGTLLTYTGTIADGSTAIFVRQLNSEPDFRMLPGTETGTHPGFSPDSRWIVFRRNRDGSLVRMSASGGGQTSILNNAHAANPHWGTPGQIVYSGPPGLFIIPATGGTPKQLHGLAGRRPFLLPDGSGVLGNVGSNAVVYDLRTDSVTILVRGAHHPVYSSSGHLVYADDQGGLSVVPFDLRRHRVTGPPVRVLDRVASNTSSRAFSVSDNGTLVQAEGIGNVGAGNNTWLVLGDHDGRADTLRLEGGRRLGPRISPNGRSVAYGLLRESGGYDVYIHDLITGTNTQVTSGGSNTFNAFPVWSPDGTRLLYAKDSSGTGTLRIKAADSSRAEQVLVAGPSGGVAADAWVRDDLIVYSRSPAAGALRAATTPSAGDLMTFALDSPATPRPYLAAPWPELDAAVSPDGRYAAFTAREFATPEIWLREFPTPVGKWKVSPNGGRYARWSPDGKYIYYLKSRERALDSLFRAEVIRSPSLVVRAPALVATMHAEGFQPWDLHPDGKRFIVALTDVAGPTGDWPRATRHVVILNWFTELNAIVNRGSTQP